MYNAVRTRQRMLAVALPLTAALYIGAEGLDPKGTDQLVTTTATAFKVLPIAASHSTQLYGSGSLSELALGAVAVSYAAIAMLVRARLDGCHHCGRAWRYRCFLWCHRQRLRRHQSRCCCDSACSREAAARFLIANFNSGPGQTFTDVYAFSEYFAPVIMGVALWRSRRVPRWLAVLFSVGFELAEDTTSVGPVKVVLQMALFTLAMVLLRSPDLASGRTGGGGPVPTSSRC